MSDELLQRVFKHSDLQSLLALPLVCKRVRNALAIGSIVYESLTIGLSRGTAAWTKAKIRLTLGCWPRGSEAAGLLSSA